MCQALAKRKSALHKSKLADAALQEAWVKAKLCHSRAQHAKHVSEAANTYIKHVRWTIERSKCKQKSDLSNCTYHVTTVTNPGVHRVQVNHIVNIPGGSNAITLD